MELKVNGQKLDVTLEGESSVGDVLKSFEAEASKNDATTIGITLDGKAVPPESFNEILTKPITDSTVIDLQVISKIEILTALQVSSQKFKEISPKLSEIPVLLQSGKDGEANSIINNLAAEIDNFCHTATLSALFPDLYNQIKIENMDMASFFEDFTPVLSDFEQSLSAKDTVTVGDLAEYEIGPRLEKLTVAISAIK